MIKRKQAKKSKSKKRKNPYFDDFQNIPLTNEEIRTLHFDLEDAFENGNKSALAEAMKFQK